MRTILLAATLLVAATLSAQTPYNAALPNGYTKRAMVAEQVGLTNVTITYNRPAVNGREGKIWGTVVHKGFADQGFGNRKPAPWRAGANETTTIEFDKDVTIEGKALSKGRYGLFIAYDPTASTVVFSRQTDVWGSFFYDEKDDALRVTVQPQPLEKSVELMKFEFSNQTQNGATVTLQWEKLAIPFKIEVDYKKQQFDALVAESQNVRGFTAQGLSAASNWCVQNNYELEQALAWATQASSATFPGDPTSFQALSAKASVLQKMGRNQEAAAALQASLPFGSVAQLQQLGRQLLTAKQNAAAMMVFQYNYDKHPDQFVAIMGMVRGLSAGGDYAKALEFANRALPLAPNDQNKQAVQGMIEKLKAGKDVNQ